MSQFDQAKNNRSLFSLSKRPLKVGGIFLIVALLLWGGVFFFFAPKPFDTLSGTIYMTLAPQGDRVSDLYRFDIKTRQFTKIFDDNFVKYTGKISPKGNLMAFLSSPIDRMSNLPMPYKEFLQVKIYNEDTKVIDRLTDIDTTNKRVSGWSPDGTRVAYFSQPPRVYDNSEDDFNDFYEPNKWSIDVVDLDGKMQHIDTGVSSLWSPDGTQLLFMKNDGFYTYDFSEGIAKKIYDDDMIGDMRTNMKFNISEDGKNFAWSIPGRNRLLLFKVLSWKPFAVNLVKDIGKKDTSIFWPVFSPDGRYVVFQEADTMPDSQSLSHPRLMVYDIITSEYLKLSDLDQYNFNIAFVDDWK